MVSPTVKLNNRPGLNAMQVTSSHILVPIESLTTSPTSSTGSASVLEWNSNSDGELLQLSSPSASLTAPLSPPPLSPSVIFTMPLADATRNDATQPVDTIVFSSSESAIPEVWTPVFEGLVTSAPIFSRDNTIIIDDDNTTANDTIRPPQDPEVDKLRDLFDNGFWRESLSDVGLPGSSDEARSPTPSSNVHNPFSSSMTSTIILQPQSRNTSLSLGPVATSIDERTTMMTPRMLYSPIESPPLSPFFQPAFDIPSSMMSSEVPQRPTPIPIGEAPKKATPIPISQAPQRPRPIVIKEEAISIAEYFQRKAMVSDLSPPRTPETTFTPRQEAQLQVVEDVVQRRPASSHSALSYVTELNSPVSPNLREQLPIQRSPSPTPRSPSVQSVVDQRSSNHEDNLLTYSTTLESPVVQRRQINNNSFWNSSIPAIFDSFGTLNEPSGSVWNASSVGEFDNLRPKPGPFSFPSSGPRRPVFARNANAVEPQRKEDLHFGGQWLHPVSPPLPHAFPSPREQVTTPDPRVFNVSPFLGSTKKSEPEERKSPVNVNASQPLPRSTFSCTPVSEQDHTYPKIRNWLVDSARATRSSTSAFGNARLRPLPPAPKIDVTPQFALRSELDKPQIPEEECYAHPMPSNWGTNTRNVVSPPPPFSPVPSRNRNRYPCPSETTIYSPVSVIVNLAPPPGPVPPPSPPTPPPRPPVIVTQCTSPHIPACGIYPPTPPQPPVQVFPPSQGTNPPFYRSPASGSYCQPTYTDSTLPRDRRLPPPSSPNWDPHYPSIPQTARRLRFAGAAPLSAAPTTTPAMGPVPGVSFKPGPSAPPIIPPYASLGPTFFNNNRYIYQTPAPVIPQFPSTPTSNPPPPPTTSFHGYTSSNWGFPSNRKYWFTDGSVIFRVEDCLYRVHRHFFEKHSDYISRLLTTYGPYDLSSHVYLPDVKKIEFERLLSIFYPTDLTKPDVTTVSGWTSILGLSQKWQMTQITSLAIQRLTPLTTAVEKLSIARNHNFLPNHEWILPAYVELCSRRSPLTLEEAEELDLATVVKIWEVQHGVMLWTYRCGMCPDARIVDMVKEKFGYANANAMGYPPSSSSLWDAPQGFYP